MSTQAKSVNTERTEFFAFISYNQHDITWGKKLHRKLVGYRMPATMCSEHGWKRKPIDPVFFAPYDIQPGGLSRELQERLKASKHLIVICSPQSAKSEWVGKEIEYFHSLGRADNIHLFIVDGEPHSGNPDTECLNPKLDELDIPEILGANIHEKVSPWPWVNRERAYIQLITKLLGVEFDTIWRRHKRLLIQRIITQACLTLLVLASLIAVWVLNQPFDANIRLNENSEISPQLPPLSEAVVTLRLDDEVKIDTIHKIDRTALFVNIPHRYLGKEVAISVRCPEWLPVDTIVALDRQITIDIRRDTAVYGNVCFRLWDISKEQAVAGCKVRIAGIETRSDDEGLVKMFVPLNKQQAKYKVESERSLEYDTLGMPCGEHEILIVQ